MTSSESNDIIEQCRLCGSNEFAVVYELPEYTYVRCSQCALVRRYQGLSPNTQKQIYGKEYFTNSPSRKSHDCAYDYVSNWQWRYDQKRFEEELQEIARYKKGGKILDVGAATGNFLKIAQAAGYNVTGVEFSPFAAAYARERGYQVHTGALEDISFPPESFDVVTLHHVLEHVPNPVETMSLIHYLLKSNGLLVIEVPNFASFRSRINGTQWEDLRPNEHLHQFEPKTLSRIVEKCLFRILAVKTKSEVLWSLKEPLKLLQIPDRVINSIEATLFQKSQGFPEGNAVKMDKRPSPQKRMLLGLTWFIFFPIVKMYEKLSLEKRLIVFAEKQD